jgi:mRNA interferase MazF
MSEADYGILDWKKGGLLTESYARLGKQATIEKHYIVRKLGTLGTGEIEKVKSILRKIYSL